MSAAREKLYLVDGSGYIFRAYYAIRPLSTRTGVPTNAVIGFAKMLGKLIKDEHPHLLGIAFDTSKRTFRHEMYGEYKANREERPEDLAPQFPLIHELVGAMDIPLLEAQGYEADDVIATLTRQGVDRGYDVVVVTGDKDLMQLVRPHVTLYDPMKDKRYGRDEVVEKFGVPPEHVVDVLALCGDTSDNIPGVPKVGPKSAAKLVAEYGGVEAVLQALGAPGKKLKAVELSVLEHAADARLSLKLATLAEDVPLTLEPQGLRYEAPEPARLGAFLHRIEATGLMREMGLDGQAAGDGFPATAAGHTSSENEGDGDPSAVAVAEASVEAPGTSLSVTPLVRQLLVVTERSPVERGRQKTVVDKAELAAFLTAAREAAELSLDLELVGPDPNRDAIVGVALAAPGLPPIYVPIAHRYLGVPRQLPLAEVLALLKPVLEDARVKKLGGHLKHDWVALHRAGIVMQGLWHDATLAAWVLDASRASYSLDSLAREVLGHDKTHLSDVVGTGKNIRPFEEAPVEAAGAYAAESAEVALHICRGLGQKLQAERLEPLYRELEVPLMTVLARMERTGVRVDPTRLEGVAKDVEARLAAIERRAHELIGEKVNLASPKQLSELLFKKLGYGAGRKTKTGFSTDSDVLEALAKEHELPRVILDHRILSKLKSTYIDMLPRMINRETGRVHTSYNQTGTATGRLSSSDPNLQNIPIRTEDGRKIRAAFVPEPGWALISADYSQIELRIMAHLSGDDRFIDAFLRGEDIHARTAQEIITGGAPADAEARRRAKAINFGILYGLSEFGLQKQLEITRAESAAYIALYFARYPKIRAFLDRTIEQGRTQGFVSTMLGRRRFLPDLHSKNRNIRQGAERIAMNTPIQGSAADVIKLAMLKVAGALEREGRRARLLLQVHDELVLEAPMEERDSVVELLKREMSGVMQLAVPLEVDVGVGEDWSGAH